MPVENFWSDVIFMTSLFFGKNEPVSIKSNVIAEGKFRVSAMAQRLISFCIFKMTVTHLGDSDSYKSEFSFKEFLSALSIKRCSQKTLALIKQATEECQKAFISYENDDVFVTMPWFSSCVVDKKKDIVSFSFNADVGRAIVDYSNGYIVEKLQIVGKLQSYYAMRWYDLTMIHKGQQGQGANGSGEWYCDYSIQQIRDFFGIRPDEYSGRMDNFFVYVVEKPIADLNRVNTKYRIVPQKIRDCIDSRKIVGVRLVCSQDCSQELVPSDVVPVSESDRLEVVLESGLIERYKADYPLQWREAEREFVSSLPEQSLKWTSQAYIDGVVLEKLKGQGLS